MVAAVRIYGERAVFGLTIRASPIASTGKPPLLSRKLPHTGKGAIQQFGSAEDRQSNDHRDIASFHPQLRPWSAGCPTITVSWSEQGTRMPKEIRLNAFG